MHSTDIELLRACMLLCVQIRDKCQCSYCNFLSSYQKCIKIYYSRSSAGLLDNKLVFPKYHIYFQSTVLQILQYKAGPAAIQ